MLIAAAYRGARPGVGAPQPARGEFKPAPEFRMALWPEPLFGSIWAQSCTRRSQRLAELLLNPSTPTPEAAPIGERKWIVALAAAVAILALAAIALYPVWRTKPGGTASLVGGAFELRGPDGRVVTDADMKGQPFLVYFGYTNCPDVCPTTLAEISDVLARLPGKPIRALFITIDPERDTAQSLKDYVASFDPRIIGLSGDRAAIDKVEKAYRVYARKGPPEKGGYAMDHSSIVYLMDKEGRFVEAFNLERKPEESAKELEGYLSEEPSAAPSY
jgi:protein SCO1/2